MEMVEVGILMFLILGRKISVYDHVMFIAFFINALYQTEEDPF
jgi:hypothetical protein